MAPKWRTARTPARAGNSGRTTTSARRCGSSCIRIQVVIREAEQRAYDLFLQNLVKGTSHLSLGQEAVAAGFACAMQKGDLTFCTYRGHAHTLARGVPVEKVLGELMQRDNGLMRGKGGSMHLTSVEHGVMGSYAIIGAHLPIACGAAWRAQYKGAGRRVGVLLRRRHDEYRRVPRGAQFRRGLEAAGGLRVREQPLHGIHADRRRDGGRASGGDRAAPTASSAIVIDGNDADEVYRTAQAAYDKARAGEGPSLIECLTYRHSGHSRADPAQIPARGRARALAEARSDQHLSRAAEAVRHRRRQVIARRIEADVKHGR